MIAISLCFAALPNICSTLYMYVCYGMYLSMQDRELGAKFAIPKLKI